MFNNIIEKQQDLERSKIEYLRSNNIADIATSHFTTDNLSYDYLDDDKSFGYTVNGSFKFKFSIIAHNDDIFAVSYFYEENCELTVYKSSNVRRVIGL